jgi:hypothetical protein
VIFDLKIYLLATLLKTTPKSPKLSTFLLISFLKKVGFGEFVELLIAFPLRASHDMLTNKLGY